MSDFTGLEGAKRNLATIAKRTKNKVFGASKEEMRKILSEARAAAPRDTGELQNSGHLEVKRDALRNKIDIIFDAPHAATVHEDPESPGHKFLTKTMDRRQGNLVDDIAEAAKVG